MAGRFAATLPRGAGLIVGIATVSEVDAPSCAATGVASARARVVAESDGCGSTAGAAADPRSLVRIALFGTWIVIVYQAFSCSLEDMRHVWLVLGMLAGAVDAEKSPGVAEPAAGVSPASAAPATEG